MAFAAAIPKTLVFLNPVSGRKTAKRTHRKRRLASRKSISPVHPVATRSKRTKRTKRKTKPAGGILGKLKKMFAAAKTTAGTKGKSMRIKRRRKATSGRRTVGRIRRHRSRRRSLFALNPVAAPAVSRRRRRKSAAPAMRKSRRSRRGGMRSYASSALSGVKSVFTRDNLILAGGSVAATVATNLALRTFGTKLPFMTNTATGAVNHYGAAAYQVLIPVVLAFLTKGMSPALARGMIIGGLANGAGSIVNGFMSPTTTTAPATTQAYLDAGFRPVQANLAQLAGQRPSMAMPFAGVSAAYAKGEWN